MEQVVKIDREVLNKALNVIAKMPYEQVFQIIDEIQKDITKKNPEIIPQTKTDNTDKK